MTFLLTSVLLAPGFAQAMDCSSNISQPLRSATLAPIASELALADSPLGAPSGVLSQIGDMSQSVDQVLLRIRIDSCQNMANIAPATGVVNPDDPAAYKPRTAFDNTPWRFNMSQNGKNMTADEFSAWMQSKGVHVARGAAPAPVVQPTAPQSAPAAQSPTPDPVTNP
nr:hypothetical protein [Lysobacter profundi]